jgi:hypothetical protein
MFDTLRDALFLFHAVGVDLGLLADHVCGLQIPVSCVRAVGEKENREGEQGQLSQIVKDLHGCC